MESHLLLAHVGAFDIGDASDLLLSLLDNAEGDDGKVWYADASSDGLSLALTSSAGSVGSSLYNQSNAALSYY